MSDHANGRKKHGAPHHPRRVRRPVRHPGVPRRDVAVGAAGAEGDAVVVPAPGRRRPDAAARYGVIALVAVSPYLFFLSSTISFCYGGGRRPLHSAEPNLTCF